MADDRTDLIDRIRSDWARERPELDTSAMEIIGRIIHLGGTFRAQADQALKGFDLHYSDLDVLATLRRSGAPYQLNPTELMKSVLLTSGAMTAALGRLGRADLITRRPDSSDGRVRAVRLSDKGHALIDQAIPVRFQIAWEAVAELSQDDRQRLGDLLRKLSLTTGPGV